MGLTPWTLGVIFLVAVTLIWTFASLLTQYIYKDLGFESPFVLTYVSSSYFALHLPLYALLRYFGIVHHTDNSSRVYSELQSDGADSVDSDTTDGGQVSTSDNGDRSLLRHSSLEQDGSRPKIDNKVFSHPSSSLSSSWDTSFRNWCRSTIKPLNADYTRSDIIRLGLLLCPIWLSSNLLYNYSLLLTSIASSTIISNTSGVFALVFAWILDAEVITHSKLLGVFLCVVGVVLVSLQDREEADGAVAHSLWGDIVAAFGAALYGLFSTVLKVKMGSDEAIPMQLVLGWMGLLTAMVFMPILVLIISMDWDNVSSFTARIFGFISLSSLFDDVLGDYLFARAVLLTSPTVANVSMSMTIPLAIISDAVSSYFYGSEKYRLAVSTVIGAILVILGFTVVTTGSEPMIKLMKYFGLYRSNESANTASLSSQL